MQDFNHNEIHREDKAAIGAQTPDRRAQVVVLGAGLAGLAAAHRLHKAGVKDVIILEAQSRIGGRIHTVDHSDYLLELGAQWLHGADDNPLYKWLMDRNMLDDFEDASAGFKGLFCSNKRRVIDAKLVDLVLNIANESKLSLSKNRHTSNDQNAADVFRHYLREKVEQDNYLKQNEKLVYAIFEWFLKYETVENSADSMSDVSVTSYTDWTDWGDGTLLNFKQGYRGLVNWFCEHMPSKEWIHLNKSVVNIEMLNPFENNWIDSNATHFSKPILLKYSNIENYEKSPNLGLIECDHVIFTASLGFLKHNYVTMFTPPLPSFKQELIESVGFGTVNKIFIEFETPFWNGHQAIKLVWEDQDLNHLPDWTRDIVSFDVVRKQPNVLLAWVGGHGAKDMEKESNEKIAEICLEVLDHFLPSYIKPSKLVTCISSRWYSNPYFKGSYSFQSMRSFGQNVDKLHEPLFNRSSENGKLASITATRAPRVLFAGEATSGKLYSTAHGAIISGWREADRLIDFMTSVKSGNLVPISTKVNSPFKTCV